MVNKDYHNKLHSSYKQTVECPMFTISNWTNAVRLAYSLTCK